MLNCGERHFGFEVLSRENVDELAADCYLLKHEKTGARLLYVETEDDNKVFSISFRTPPSDSSGVAHILEHSVLCGSRKFKLKEPFVELVKGSMNTFLNAMTFPDKTMYPVASRNEQDFRNLMDVYLDAVFFPLIYERPEIFKQEGWHYELEDAASELNYKGVVYNEMKGVFSSPDTILEQAAMEELFPDNTYGYESGGDPKHIPSLTYDDFLDFHKRYYHPANAYFYLYGDMDILETLKFINEEYLNGFSAGEASAPIPKQVMLQESVRTASYPLPMNEDPGAKSYLNMSFVVGEGVDAELTLAMQLLNYILLESPAAPVKKALIAAGVGKEVSGSYAKSMLQPVFSVIVSGAEKDDAPRFQKTLFAELKRLQEQGLDRMLINAAVQRMEFSLREANFGSYPKGLIYNIRCMDSWLYDADPLLHLAYEKPLQKIKSEIENGYFEKLLERYFIGNLHRVMVLLMPEPGLGEVEAETERKKLFEHRAGLSESELQGLAEETKVLRLEQERPDSPEALASIPLLAINDIKKECDSYECETVKVDCCEILQTYCDTRGILYLNLYFDLTQIAEADIPLAYLLTECLGKIDTKKNRYEQLVSRVDLCSGGIDYGVKIYTQHDDHREFTAKLVVKTKVLAIKLEELLDLLREILQESDFSKEQRLEELVRELKSDWQTNLFRRGQQLVNNRVLSYFSPAAKFAEGGALEFYRFLCRVEKNWAKEKTNIIAGLQRICRQVMTQNDLHIGITMERGQQTSVHAALKKMLQSLPQKFATQEIQKSAESGSHNEGLLMPAQVQYVVKGANYRDLGYEYSGSMKVLETILRYDYLWTKIRVQGGAYGAFARFDRNGNMVFGSYRDPNLIETLETYDQTSSYLEELTLSERDMVKYIIGTMSQVDMPLTSQQKGEFNENCHWRRISREERQKERSEILATKPEDIKALAQVIKTAMVENHLCVMGNETTVREAKECFESLLDLGSF